MEEGSLNWTLQHRQMGIGRVEEVGRAANTEADWSRGSALPSPSLGVEVGGVYMVER